MNNEIEQNDIRGNDHCAGRNRSNSAESWLMVLERHRTSLVSSDCKGLS